MLTVRAAWLFWIPNIVFVGALAILGETALIAALNAAIISLALGVCVAYAPTAWRVVTGQVPLNSVHWLALGIFVSWLGTEIGRWWSLVWRGLGQPPWLASSWIVAYGLMCVCAGAFFHLIADEAIGAERVPPKRWLRWGAVVAASVLVVLLLTYAVDRWSEAGAIIGEGLG